MRMPDVLRVTTSVSAIAHDRLMTRTSITFEHWILEVDRLCRAHLACSWNDLCGDIAPLRSAFDVGEHPLQFVRGWAEKYDLEWNDALDFRQS